MKNGTQSILNFFLARRAMNWGRTRFGIGGLDLHTALKRKMKVNSHMPQETI